MKKNAVLTWFHFDNYGTNLQAYSLQQALNNKGYDTTVINYIPEYKSEKKENIFKRLIKKIVFFLFDLPNIKLIKDKKILFNKFVKNNIRITDKEYSKENLVELNDKFDNFIVGSDQIWNPNFNDLTYFLDFVNKKNKISYAPSFGVSKLDDQRNRELQPYLTDFNYISVREENGVEIVKKIIDKRPNIVLDPTFLLEKKEWEKFVKPYTSEKYILCYFLSDRKYYWKYLKKLKKETGLSIKIIPITRKSYYKKDSIKNAVGPEEFINLIANAEIICTDSFHGAVFSIIFEKKLSILKRFDDVEKKSQNSRIYNLLKTFNIEDMLIDSDFKNVKYDIRNYDFIHKKLTEKINDSFEYLENSINRR